MTLFPGLLERLSLSDSHTIALGTLQLDTVASSCTTLECEPSTSAPDPIWKTYTPGLLRDLADERLQAKKKLKGSNGKLSRDSPTFPKSPTKRKRSASSSSITPSNGQHSTAPNSQAVPLPTLLEIDHLVKNAFIAVEYTFLNKPDPVKQEDNIAEELPQDIQGACSCLFRIYAVPLDAPGLNSRIEALGLKIRSKATKALAQKTFTKLLYHISYDAEEFKSGAPSSERKHLLPRGSVSGSHVLPISSFLCKMLVSHLSYQLTLSSTIEHSIHPRSL